jgi:hypothetical protein
MFAGGNMATDLRTLVETTRLDVDDIKSRTRHIYDAVLSASPVLDGGNFTRIHTRDLGRLFDLYDERFFVGQIRATLGSTPLHFQLSTRLTKAGGKTTRYAPRPGTGTPSFVISVSTPLLFQCFQGQDHRPITASGIVCADRLESLQRVMEHEVVHLVESLLWDRSSCSAERFQSIALRFFGHIEHKHQLITQTERAYVERGIHRGSRVRFRFDGAQYHGIVNRITKRATVLVEDERGMPYSDGKRYKKFYVPIGLLERCD